MTLEHEFQSYFRALDRSGDEDRCFLCRRTPAEVKAFFGFHEDGTPIDAERYGIEDVVLDPELDIMSYRGSRPVCSVCQLNLESILLTPDGPAVLRKLFLEMEHERDRLWSRQGIESDPPRRDG
jgi:hypothetical protein